MRWNESHSVPPGDLLFQTFMLEEPTVERHAMGALLPARHDVPAKRTSSLNPTIFWLFNSACCLAMLSILWGLSILKSFPPIPIPLVVKASSLEPSCGVPPDQTQAPWS